jgi:hypothetical protein
MAEQNQDVSSLSAGTRFPFISLEKALGRASELFTADQKGREMTITGAFAVWDYSEKSSGGFQTVAALKMYGLLKDSLGTSGRRVGLTDAALRYFRDEREEEKAKLLKEFALKPKLIGALWGQWHAAPPADTIARSHLKAERGINDQGARSLLAIYKENMTFAKLKGDDKVPSVEGEEEPETAEVLASVQARGHIDLPPPPPRPPPPPGGKGKLLEGERELTAGLLSKEASFRLIVNGPVGVKEIERLIKKLELDKEILAEQGDGNHDSA